MCEQDRLRTAKHIFDAIVKSGDTSPLVESLTDDVKFRLTVAPGTPLSGIFIGKEGVQEYLARNEEFIQTDKLEVLNYLVGGDQVAVVGREHMTVKRSGSTQWNSDWVTLFTFRGNKIAEVLVVEDTTAIFTAHR
jgi:ketosteroid isomerase-like protein